ncbi:MAG TPA: hypothetical protein VNM15_05600 [Candidatus Binatia bacterium]|nr:hypothetical protein [Candidatus Binatia bacterium]
MSLRRPLAIVLVGSLLALAAPLYGQEPPDMWLERIVNPVPEYDPFEKPLPPPRFFPDAVDKRARELLIDALTNRPDAVREHVQFFRAEDRRLRRESNTRTGLTEHAEDLANNTIVDRERYLQAQKEALKQASTAERKKYLEAIIRHDDLNRADDLLRQGAVNRWAGWLNRMLGSVDLVGVASGNYVGAAAETVIAQLYALAESDMPVEERRALARHLDHVKRFPDDPRNVELRKQIERLEKAKKRVLVKKQLARAEEAAAKSDLERALFHAEVAAFIDPDSKQAAQRLEALAQRREQRQRSVDKGLAAAREPAYAAAHEQAVRRLLTALSTRDPQQIELAAIEFEKKTAGTPLAAAALDAEAVAMEIRGRHEVAKKLLEQIARSAADSDDRKRAAALLESEEYNLLAAFDRARSERLKDSAKYVVLGEDLLKKNLLYGAGIMAAAGPAGAAMLGAVNTLMVGTNLINVLTNNPVSAQPVIDAGVAYIRSHPDSDSAQAVYRVLAEAYEERGLYQRAINFHGLAGSPEEKIAALKEKAAKALLDAGAKSQTRSAQEHYLTALIDHYPGTAAAAEATKKLAALARDGRHGLRMSKQFLLENPEIYGASGLGLKATLLDGNPSNMELAERGVTLVDDNELVVHYQTPWGTRSQTYPVTKSSADRFYAALRRKNQQIALADADRRAKGSAGGIKHLPVAVLHGRTGSGAERTAEEEEETTFSFVREAAARAPAHERVLDHELLSENERDPSAKYKLPPVQGTVSASRFSMTGALPASIGGNQIAVGGDHRSPYGGVQLPIPLIEGFIPMDFMVQGRPGGVSIYPRIKGRQDNADDPELYR